MTDILHESVPDPDGYDDDCLQTGAEVRARGEADRDHLPEWMRKPADAPEPSTPPAQQPGERRAAAGPPPGTLDGPGVLGRALLDRRRRVWLAAGAPDEWTLGLAQGWWTRPDIEEDAGGPVREVLLVDPAAGRVTGEQYPRQDGEVTVLGPDIFASADGKVICWKGRNYVPQPAPEPAGDGPGCPHHTDPRACAVAQDAEQYGTGEWDRAIIQGLLGNLDGLDDEHRQPKDRCRSAVGDHLRALLADRDRLAKLHQAAQRSAEWWVHETRKVIGERDAARAELAEVTAERDRYAAVLADTERWALGQSVREFIDQQLAERFPGQQST